MSSSTAGEVHKTAIPPPAHGPSHLPDPPVFALNSPLTASSDASLPSRPLPILPTDLKREILRFCDQGTLANTSRVSLAFLQISSPLLYRDVVVRGYSALRALVDPPTSPVPLPHLDPFFSLEQIESFTFLVDPAESEGTGALFSPQGRRISSNALSHVGTASVEISPTDTNHIEPPSLPLLGLLDPVHITLAGVHASQSPRRSFTYVELYGLPWTRLRSITFVNSGATSLLANTSFLCGPGKLRVVFDVSNRWLSGEYEHWFDSISNALDDILGTEGGERAIHVPDSILSSPWLELLVITVQHEQHARQISEIIWEAWEIGGLEQEMWVKWSEMIEFGEADTGTSRRMSSML